jgi:hypothetical protein
MGIPFVHQRFEAAFNAVVIRHDLMLADFCAFWLVKIQTKSGQRRCCKFTLLFYNYRHSGLPPMDFSSLYDARFAIADERLH